MALTKILNPEYSEEASPASEEHRKLAFDAAKALGAGFSWGQSAEGHDFWASVYSRLMAISEGEPL